jgi:two-component system, chemotaxis family, sensor kinase CheA
MSQDSALDTFITESSELLRDMESVLLRCENGESDAESINELFRAAHTIKGSAGLFGLDPIVAFTHVVESVLDRVREDSTPVTAPLAAILLECRDHIRQLVDAVVEGEQSEVPALSEAGAAILEKLTTIAGVGTAKKAAATAPPTSVPATTRSRASGEAQHAGESKGLRVDSDTWHLSVRFDRAVLKHGMDPLAFIRYLTTFCTFTGLQIVEDSLPARDEFDAEACYIGFEIGLRTDATKSQIEAAFEFVRDDCQLRILPPRSLVSDYVALIRDLPEAEGHLGELLVQCGTLTAQELDDCLQAQAERKQAEGEAPPIGEMLVERKLVQPAVLAAAVQTQVEARASKESKALEGRSIRVDGDKLDRLIDLIGELIIAGAATGSQARAAGLSHLNESALHLARIVEEVRDQALKLRIVQIGPTFARFQRVVRDVARESGKEIVLETNGTDTELDKTLVERIADPLTHLVRNAIDHGIELPEVRKDAGKPPCGVVRLNAYHDAGAVVIEITDDGGGLKRDLIRQKAIERGLIQENQALSDSEVYALIFEPGFSTADQVTNLSGRGVGMDVVKSNVSALRGTVEIDSQAGKGTQVRLRLPLTLAIIDGFQVGVGRSSFVIPLDLVEECVELNSGGADGTAESALNFNLHGSVLPLIRLRTLFEIAGKPERRESIVVVHHAGKRVGIIVDELLGELQAVIKPLSRLFKQLQGIGGSTILGSGKVALILDVPGLVERTKPAHPGPHDAVQSGMRGAISTRA